LYQIIQKDALFTAAYDFKSCFPHRPEVVVNQQLPDILYLFDPPKSLKNPSPSNVLPREKHE
jgi:hypothetical protein